MLFCVPQMTWGWVSDNRILIFGGNVPLGAYSTCWLCSCSCLWERMCGWYLMSGTRLGRQIEPEESISTPLQQSTKSLPVAFLSSFDPWSTLPINRAQLWPLTWPLSPGCCWLTSPLEQQREEITSDIASARCPKPLLHIAVDSLKGENCTVWSS